MEWQFYLLLPLGLLGVWKYRPGRRSITLAIGAGFVFSLALSAGLTPYRAAAAFYLLPTRAWEMLAGGLVWQLARHTVLSGRQRTMLESAGVGLVALAIAGFDSASPWPGHLALLPVVGSVLVLVANAPRSLWTGQPLAQWLGSRSYSIYLWHWPLVVTLTNLEIQTDWRAIAAGMAMTLVLGHLSFRWVETLARRRISRLPLRRGATALLGATFVIVAGCVVVHLKMGVAGRFAPEVERVAQDATDRKPHQAACLTTGGTSSPSCIYGGERLRAILIGDSHADAMTTALAASVPDTTKDGIMDWTYVSCLTARGVRNPSPLFGPDEKCSEFLEWAVHRLADIPRDIPLVIVNRTSAYAVGPNEPRAGATPNTPLVYFDQRPAAVSPAFLVEFARHVTDTACELARTRAVYMVRPTPELVINVPKVMVRAMAMGVQRDISISLTDYHRRHDFVWAAQDAARDRCGVKILDPLPYLCRDGRCQAQRDGRPLYYDDNHLSEFGNKLLVPMFAEVFQKN